MIHTRPNPSPWPVLLLLLAAVLAPTACVLWFLGAAVRNERLAVRQKLRDVYSAQLAEARPLLERWWNQKRAALELALAEEQPPGQDERGWALFRRLTTEGGFDSAVVGAVSAALPPVEQEPGADAPLAEARALAQAGHRGEAAALLLDRFGGLTEPPEGSRAPEALLWAAELARPHEAEPFRQAVERLHGWLEGDRPAVRRPGRRLFLMRRLRELTGDAALFPALEAEELALAWVESETSVSAPGALTPTRLPGVWQLCASDGRTVALLREATLVREAGALLDQHLRPASATLRLLPPDAPQAAAADATPFLTIPGDAFLPGWRLALDLTGPDPFEAAARRQIAAYLWTGGIGIAAMALLAALAAHHLRRQMRVARLKNDLIATVSHELKTPLASMRVLVDTLLEGRCATAAQAQEYLRMVARENQRLSRLIDNFLAFSRMERNKQAFEREPLEASAFIAPAVEALRERFDAAGCRPTVALAPGTPRIVGDRDALTTVVVNLLDNALKYSGGEPRIAVRAFAENGSLCLEVADQGIGIPRGAQRRVFERFFQVDRRLARSAGGCGLGLSIVKYIVEGHHGSIDVRSEVGRGSVFTVRLPAQRDGKDGSGDERG